MQQQRWVHVHEFVSHISFNHRTSSTVTSTARGAPTVPGRKNGEGSPFKTSRALHSTIVLTLGSGLGNGGTTAYDCPAAAALHAVSTFRNGCPHASTDLATSTATVESSIRGLPLPARELLLPPSLLALGVLRPPELPPPCAIFAEIVLSVLPPPLRASPGCSPGGVGGSAGNSSPKFRRQKISSSSGVLGLSKKSAWIVFGQKVKHRSKSQRSNLTATEPERLRSRTF